MDAVEAAGSGHPGTAMSLAPAAYLLFQRHLRHDPSDPAWVGRDRFVLSCGHSSVTLYIQLLLSGYGLTVEDLSHLRQWGSLTPGHPEHGHTIGVETTTGPPYPSGTPKRWLVPIATSAPASPGLSSSVRASRSAATTSSAPLSWACWASGFRSLTWPFVPGYCTSRPKTSLGRLVSVST